MLQSFLNWVIFSLFVNIFHNIHINKTLKAWENTVPHTTVAPLTIHGRFPIEYFFHFSY
jgi:hypothetical protein